MMSLASKSAGATSQSRSTATTRLGVSLMSATGPVNFRLMIEVAPGRTLPRTANRFSGECSQRSEQGVNIADRFAAMAECPRLAVAVGFEFVATVTTLNPTGEPSWRPGADRRVQGKPARGGSAALITAPPTPRGRRRFKSLRMSGVAGPSVPKEIAGLIVGRVRAPAVAPSGGRRRRYRHFRARGNANHGNSGTRRQYGVRCHKSGERRGFRFEI